MVEVHRLDARRVREMARRSARHRSLVFSSPGLPAAIGRSAYSGAVPLQRRHEHPCGHLVNEGAQWLSRIRLRDIATPRASEASPSGFSIQSPVAVCCLRLRCLQRASPNPAAVVPNRRRVVGSGAGLGSL